MFAVETIYDFTAMTMKSTGDDDVISGVYNRSIEALASTPASDLKQIFKRTFK